MLTTSYKVKMKRAVCVKIVVIMVLTLLAGCKQELPEITGTDDTIQNEISSEEAERNIVEGDFTCIDVPNTCTEKYSSVVDTKKAEYSYEEMLKDINRLVKKFGGKVKKDIIGYSELGREIPVMVIGDDNAPDKYLALGASHGREYIASVLLMKNVEFYLHNYDNTVNGEKLSDLFSRCQFHFIPMHNPDGVMLSQQGLKSLDIVKDKEERQEYIDFLMPLMEDMNNFSTASAKDILNRDSEWSMPKEGEHDFTYWKSNINGVDVHDNMNNEKTLNWLLPWYNKPGNESYVAGPCYWNYIGEQPLTEKESLALADYCKKYCFNIAITYHATGSVYQWNYGFKRELPFETAGAVRQEKHQKISERLAGFMKHELSEGYNSHIGFTGWYLNTFPRSYSAVIELGSNAYFKAMPGYDKQRDSCPLEIEQLTTDVTNGFTQRYSIWTKHKFTPVYTVQYILNTNLISPIISIPAPPRYLAATLKNQTAEISFDVSEDTGGYPITGYKLYQSTDNLTFTDITDMSVIDENKFTVKGLSGNMKYYYKVSLLNEIGESEMSPETAVIDTADTK